jgi:glutamate synthase domain-containing protein 3
VETVTTSTPTVTGPSTTIDLSTSSVRALNTVLHDTAVAQTSLAWTVFHPEGKHSIAVGLDAALDVDIKGHVGYYCAGMNQLASITIEGNAGVGLAENMMSGVVRVWGDASQSAGATAHGGLLVIHGNASARCGISLKGADIVVGGDVGHMSAFMAQAGRLVVCGETQIYVRGSVKSLGADCIEKKMTDAHLEELRALLSVAAIDVNAADFRRYGSARTLYNFHVDNATTYS